MFKPFNPDSKWFLFKRKLQRLNWLIGGSIVFFLILAFGKQGVMAAGDHYFSFINYEAGQAHLEQPHSAVVWAELVKSEKQHRLLINIVLFFVAVIGVAVWEYFQQRNKPYY